MRPGTDPSSNSPTSLAAGRPSLFRGLRSRWFVVLVALVVVGLTVAAIVSFLWPYGVSTALSRAYFSFAGSELTPVLKPAGGSDSDSTWMAAVAAGRPISLSEDRKTLYLQVGLHDFASDSEAFRSLWSIDLSTGKYSIMGQGNLMGAVGWDDDVILIEDRASLESRRNSFLRWLYPYYRLVLFSRESAPKVLEEGDVVPRWSLLSADHGSVFYHVRDDGGLRTRVYRVKEDTKRVLDWGGVVGGENPPGEVEAVATAWVGGSDSLLRLVTGSAEGPAGQQLRVPWCLQICSATTGETLEELSLATDRIITEGPYYNEGHHLWTITRDRDHPTSAGTDQIDLFRLSPLRKVAEFRGYSVRWSPDNRYAYLEKHGIRTALPSSELGVFDASTDEIRSLDLRTLGPGFDRLAHFSQFALFSIRLPFSPDSHYFIATKGYPSRFAIIDAGTFDVVRLEEIHATEFAWSPDSRRLVFLEYTGSLPDSDGVACVLDCDTGDIHRFRLGGSMRPVAWLDPTTVVWLNHWAGTDMAGEGPLSIARVDVSSGVVQEIPVH